MFAQTIYFENGKLKFQVGVKAKFMGDEHTLHLFSKKGRDVVLPVHPDHPPRLEYPIRGENIDQQYLNLLSLVINPPHGLRALVEIDHYEKSLIFIDTYSEGTLERSPGEYSFPDTYKTELPHGSIPAKHGSAHYGLAICAPGETCSILSTSGQLTKIQLTREGKFVQVPTDAFDRALMDGRH